MAYGKKNHVNLNPLSYNIMLLGESKVGKTTLIKQVCEKLAGEDGYLFLECGHERGADAIEGINYINCPAWEMPEYDELTNSHGFADVCEDVIGNKSKDYPKLQVVVWDTYDQLINIAEAQAVKLWNDACLEREEPKKRAKSINAAWGGYGRGEKKAMELMFDMKARLAAVGVSTIVIGHVKNKDVVDVASSETYQILTSDQQQNYFNAIKKDLHFLGLAYVDRTIVKQNTGRRNAATGEDIVKGRVSAESRKVKFRDDSYAVDSGSRFADIVPEIDMDADEFIGALRDAIMKEQGKSGRSVKEDEAAQAKAAKAARARVAKAEKERAAGSRLEGAVQEIMSFFAEHKGDVAAVKPALDKCRALGYSNPKDIKSLKDAEAVLAAAEAGKA